MAGFGKIDIWLNNAGGADNTTPYKLDETTDEHWDEVVGLSMKVGPPRAA